MMPTALIISLILACEDISVTEDASTKTVETVSPVNQKKDIIKMEKSMVYAHSGIIMVKNKKKESIGLKKG